MLSDLYSWLSRLDNVLRGLISPARTYVDRLIALTDNSHNAQLNHEAIRYRTSPACKQWPLVNCLNPAPDCDSALHPTDSHSLPQPRMELNYSSPEWTESNHYPQNTSATI